MVKLDFDKIGGLVPAIIQDHRTGEVLMLGFMNEESWNLTLKEGTVVFYSRSRKKLWKKGETSGHVQIVKEISVDCDDDTLLIKVEQVGGAACHTGHRSCFFRKFDGDDLVEDGRLVFKPEDVYRK